MWTGPFPITHKRHNYIDIMLFWPTDLQELTITVLKKKKSCSVPKK